jgi:hypothetical protein
MVVMVQYFYYFILLEIDCTTSNVFPNSLTKQKDHMRLFREEPAS